MTAPRSGPTRLPAEIPIFPLQDALLLPGGRLPLNIFEPRYLAMVEDALGAGRLLGMVLPDPAFPRVAGRSTIYRTGCLGRIASFSETGDGRYLITLLGLLRYDVAQELPDHPAGYRRVQADFSPYLADLEPPEEEPDRAALLAALWPYFAARQIEADRAAIERVPLVDLVTTLSMICPFDGREKQALLLAPGPRRRAELLTALLRIGAASSEGPARPV
ncbi:LON peptidase substrate-binding domain-containing protein [Pseudoroseomonas ludipueritiae]|uniref:LON peptidase substrate-binding domain-containing protein n=1 Tax=Pseudoroseomonas ludipueritiae TaxID=198093 RepID=A0ABR7R942_9PROT|nr:LON peptidase substrate-binding domain-containing protein [Pseudoroseomonas ludipueritiae]MBC9178301.1 LON peptidase substrate-binding domain-containing protein [Pseudoroseomonas ludipueritiae]MCG7362392.1 LON peptidase substrate-binding domain-containing protein [Roseomonas sp. ACRSG]